LVIGTSDRLNGIYLTTNDLAALCRRGVLLLHACWPVRAAWLALQRA
jgi:hypothetical protein